jgi:GMP synthase PP-ATPase subunit
MPPTSSWARLAGVTDPEQKRKIIGREFVEVFEESAGKLVNAKWLAQGTIYGRDRIGRQGQERPTIKSTTTSAACRSMKLQLLEPLRDCSRTKCASWASRSACRARWSTATPSRARPGVRILAK